MKTVFITGSTQGIGKALAEAFVSKGYNVIVHCSVDQEKCERVKKEIGAFKAVTGDLSKTDEVKELYQKTGSADIIILNASVQHRKAWYEITEKEFDEQVSVNLKSTLMLMQEFYPQMKKNGFGRIITIGSVQQYKPHEDMAIYAATKCAIMNLVKNVSKQVAQFGITVNNISPGVIDTPRNESALTNEVYVKKVLEKIPMGCIGKAGDIAGAALMLSGDEGRYITGTDIVVDGGMSL